MLIAIDFDGVIVEQDRPYDDATTPLAFKPGARDGLLALKRAGHKLLLWSARMSPALFNPDLDPLARVGVRPRVLSHRAIEINLARQRQMLEFVAAELQGVFDAIDDGSGGKPIVDMFIDDRCLRLGKGAKAYSWDDIAHAWGEPAYGAPPEARSEDGGREQSEAAEG